MWKKILKLPVPSKNLYFKQSNGIHVLPLLSATWSLNLVLATNLNICFTFISDYLCGPTLGGFSLIWTMPQKFADSVIYISRFCSHYYFYTKLWCNTFYHIATLLRLRLHGWFYPYQWGQTVHTISFIICSSIKTFRIW